MPEGPRFVRASRAEIRAWAAKKDGPVDRRMSRFADRVLKRAVEYCPKGAKPSRLPKLSETLEKRSFTDDKGPVYLVGSSSPKMRWVAKGTPEHPIPTVARRRGEKMLAFEWERLGGQRVFFKKVNHPGIALFPTAGNRGANDFLRRALQDEIRTLK